MWEEQTMLFGVEQNRYQIDSDIIFLPSFPFLPLLRILLTFHCFAFHLFSFVCPLSRTAFISSFESPLERGYFPLGTSKLIPRLVPYGNTRCAREPIHPFFEKTPYRHGDSCAPTVTGEERELPHKAQHNFEERSDAYSGAMIKF